jgi:hypothetical protein
MKESQLLWLRKGDAATKFFHAHANDRRCKNFIRSLEHEGRSAASEEGKAEVMFNYFDEVLGAAPSRSTSIALEHLGLLCLDLAGLVERFTEEEVWGVIRALLPDKAPEPDGFTAGFYKQPG